MIPPYPTRPLSILVLLGGLLAMAGQAAAAPARNSRAAPARTSKAAPARSCCQAPAGTVVTVESTQEISTRVLKIGDPIPLRLAEPLVAEGQILVQPGAPVTATVVDVAKPGFGGKGAKLVVSANALQAGGRSIPLQGLQLSASGRGQATAATAVGAAGIAFAPLGIAALAIKGGQVVLPAGTRATARLASSVNLPSLGPAPRSAQTAAAAPAAPTGAIAVPSPPAGQGQVVFFRRKTLTGTGQWFNVRESGRALGKLSNGVYFILPTSPGTREYTATAEPTSKDRLRLQVDPGETYFVEGVLAKGVVIGAAQLLPSSRGAFDAASKDLKPAEPVG